MRLPPSVLHPALDVVVQVCAHSVTLLIGDDLQVRISLLVQSRMRPPQDGEIDPSELERPKLRAYVRKTLSGNMGVTKVDDGKTQSFGPCAGKRPIQAKSLAKISSGT